MMTVTMTTAANGTRRVRESFQKYVKEIKSNSAEQVYS
jgi:hypothetical protein